MKVTLEPEGFEGKGARSSRKNTSFWDPKTRGKSVRNDSKEMFQRTTYANHRGKDTRRVNDPY